MKTIKHRRLVVAIGLGSLAGMALAAKPEDAVHYRQGMLMGLGWNVGEMGAMVKGDLPFDAARFAFLAGRTAMLAPMVSEGFSPDTEAVKSHARPELWQNRADFDKRMKELETGASRLAEVAQAGDEAAMKTEFGTFVQICKGCHDEYRVKE